MTAKSTCFQLKEKMKVALWENCKSDRPFIILIEQDDNNNNERNTKKKFNGEIKKKQIDHITCKDYGTV